MNRIFPTELKPGDRVILDNGTSYTVAKYPMPACSAKPRQTFITTDTGEVIEYIVSQKVTLFVN